MDFIRFVVTKTASILETNFSFKEMRLIFILLKEEKKMVKNNRNLSTKWKIIL